MSGFVERALERWGRIAAERSRAILVAAVLVALAASPFAVRALRHLDANLFNQASASLQRFALMREIGDSFGGDLFAAAVIIPDHHSPEDVKEIKTFALMLASELEKVGTLESDRTLLTEKIKAEIDALAPKEEDAALGFVPWLNGVECRTGQGLERAAQVLARQHPHLLFETADVERLTKLFEPAELDAAMERATKTALELAPLSPERSRLYEDPLGIWELAKNVNQERLKRNAPPLARDPEGFFLSPDGTTLVILARTALPAGRLDFARALMVAVQRAENRAIAAFRATKPRLSTALKTDSFGQLAPDEAPGQIEVGYTGMGAIYVENEQTLRRDLALNTGTSLLGVLVLFLVLYRSISLTWKVTAATIYTIWLTIAFAGIWKGGMSLLGGAFTAVPVGLGTDYAILIYNTYRALREQQLNPPEAMAKTLANCGSSILTAVAITAIAFFGAGFTRLQGLAEFGVLGGVSAIIGCAVMLLIFPAWLCISDSAPGIRHSALTLGMPTLGRWLEKPPARKIALLIGALIFAGGVVLIKFGPDPGPETVAGVRFDPELGNLRSLRSRAIPLRERIAERFKIGLADIQVLVEGVDEERNFNAFSDVQARLKPYVERGELAYCDGITGIFPSPPQQRESIDALKSFDIDVSIERFQTAAQKRFGVKGAAYFNPFLRRLRELKTVLKDPQPLTLAKATGGALGLVLSPWVQLRSDSEFGVRMRSTWLPRDANMPAEWYDSLAKTLESNPPKGARIRMTAAKMVGFELKATTLADCAGITLAVAICVALSLAASLRSLKKCLLALLPLLFAYLFMLAGVPLSQWLGWDYSLNFVNLIMFPLLLGSAADYGVYMVYGWYDGRQKTLTALMSNTGRSVLYCMGTTLIGFGSFVTSSYRGLLSMGVASLWGYAGATFGALFVLPAILGTLKEK